MWYFDIFLLCFFIRSLARSLASKMFLNLFEYDIGAAVYNDGVGVFVCWQLPKTEWKRSKSEEERKRDSESVRKRDRVKKAEADNQKSARARHLHSHTHTVRERERLQWIPKPLNSAMQSLASTYILIILLSCLSFFLSFDRTLAAHNIPHILFILWTVVGCVVKTFFLLDSLAPGHTHSTHIHIANFSVPLTYLAFVWLIVLSACDGWPSPLSTIRNKQINAMLLMMMMMKKKKK